MASAAWRRVTLLGVLLYVATSRQAKTRQTTMPLAMRMRCILRRCTQASWEYGGQTYSAVFLTGVLLWSTIPIVGRRRMPAYSLQEGSDETELVPPHALPVFTGGF